ncbi:MAG: hypothetical protein CVU56_16550 [Deltaproteobacteria bacterium HGW-Deltaproteobacteria-14]|nr:MAG: hypothetical protein CVU56_16550 [Deltaproteobacteria bacterium HGW-Deltaproteobacteria-14]
MRLHWSLPVGMFVFTRFAAAPLAWLAFLALVLTHEAGHAALVRHYRLRVVGIDLHGLGGETHWLGRPSLSQRVAIAWAGVFAQGVALATVVLLEAAFGPARDAWLAQIVYVYTTANLWMIAFNLLPLPGLDGEVAWMIIPAWRRRQRPRVDGRLRRVAKLHVVRRADTVPDREAMVQAVADVDRELRAITDAHNAAADGDPPPPGRGGAGSKTRR